MDQPCHTIKMAAKLTGLSAHVIRIWEKRYGAVQPQRSRSRRRLYGDRDLERLMLLRRATELGHNIGSIARLKEEDLRELLRRGEGVGGNGLMPMPVNGTGVKGGASPYVADFLQDIRNFNQQQLVERLRQTHVDLGCQGLLVRVIAPLTHAIGEAWVNGTLTAAQEHFASAAIREYLLSAGCPYPAHASPTMVVATPAGQVHELGAVLVTFAARSQGWHAVYLGASLPAAEIAGAALSNQALAVALSIVFPADDPALSGELETLRKALPAGTKVLAGGRAARAYEGVLQRIGAMLVGDLPQLFDMLGHLRRQPAGAK